MDTDVVELLLRLLRETQFGGPGAELATLADVHARALTQVEAQRGTDPLRTGTPSA